MIEFHLQNHPDNKLPHNIDLHSVNGPGGGAESTFTAPGRETFFTFRALNPGLPEVDKEYYVMQSEFYTEDDYGERGLQPFDMNRAIEEDPEYVVFNGFSGEGDILEIAALLGVRYKRISELILPIPT